MIVEIIVIGDEIVLGLITDTNSAHIARRLAECGHEVSRITKVGDSLAMIVGAMQSASEADVVITCGGLGPTHDDRTREAVAELLGVPLRLDVGALNEIETMYEKAGRVMGDANRVQAMMPEGASYLSNQTGTAPGIMFSRNKATYFCLQGVPREMMWMLENHVVPFVMKSGAGQAVIHKTIRTVGIPESHLFEKTRKIVESFKSHIEIAFLPVMTRGVDIRLTVRDNDRGASLMLIQDAVGKFKSEIEASFPGGIYGYDEETLEQVTAAMLSEARQTVATAESCTGGLIAHRLTNIAGSSSYFSEGMITYSNQSKISELGLPPELIEKNGAVSEEVAKAMAECVRKKAGTGVGLSTTGIAGPSGATETKPVGLAYVALSTETTLICKKITPLPFAIDRISFKERLATFAIDLLRKQLMNKLS